jgi:hypothetical protein
MLRETLDRLRQKYLLENQGERFEQDPPEDGGADPASNKPKSVSMSEHAQQMRWYCVRYWRQAVAAVTIYSAMFAIWNLSVR